MAPRVRARREITIDSRLAFVITLSTILTLFAALTWTMHLEATLPDVRIPRADGASTLLPERRLLAPGSYDFSEADVEYSGAWVTQDLGEAQWRSTTEPGSRMRLAFYGTEIYLVARLGPESGVGYVLVNGFAPGHLPRGAEGARVDFRARQAVDSPVMLATDLAHGEHVLEVVSAGEGELALSGFVINAQTPFPWVFVLAYAGLAGGLLLSIRALLLQLTPGFDDPAPKPQRTRREEPTR